MENNEQRIKPKGFQDYLEEDSSLSRKMTYEEFINSTKSGLEDDTLESLMMHIKEC